MENNRIGNSLGILLALMIMAVPMAAQADRYGMMGMSDEREGMMYEHGYAPYGMGPGMGMMHERSYGSYGYGMGSGMMGGMGPGMMGGMGPGMGPLWMLDLNDRQRDKLVAIQRQQRKQQWELMGQMMDENDALRELYSKEPLDSRAIGKVYGRIFDIQRRMIELAVEAENQASALLSKEQKEQLRKWRRGGMYMHDE